MATERLQVLLELIAGQYKREATEAAASTQKISTSAKTAGTDTQKAAGTMTSSMGGVASAAKGFIGIAAVGAVGAFAKSSVEAASNLTESMNAVNVQFGTSAAGVHALGETSVESFGLSQRAFNEFAVQFSAFADNIAGASGRNVVDIVDEMATRIADFASVHNLTLEEATTVAQSTLAGETEAFRRFGGDVSAAAVELKGMEMGLGDTSAELSEQEKILIRYELFMEQTEKTAGDFANTSDGLANSQKTLSATFEDTQAAIGEALLPTLASAAGFLTDVLNAVVAAEEGWQSFGRALDEGREKIGFTGQTVLEQVDAWENHNTVIAEAVAGMEDARTHGIEPLTEATYEALRAMEDERTHGIEPNTVATYNFAEAIQANIDKLDAYQNKLRAQTDPLFALFEATNDQTAAQETLNGLIDEGITSGPEYEQALANVATEAFNVRDAQAAARVATDLTKEEFIKMATNAGVAKARAKELADVLYGLDGLKLDPIQLSIEIRELRRAAGSQAGGAQEYHTGGTVTGDFIGQEVMARLLVGETVLPIGASVGSASPTSGGGVHIENVYAMGTPASIAHDVGQQVSLEVRMA